MGARIYGNVTPAQLAEDEFVARCCPPMKPSAVGGRVALVVWLNVNGVCCVPVSLRK